MSAPTLFSTFTIASLFVGSSALAQLPSIPAGPDGEFPEQQALEQILENLGQSYTEVLVETGNLNQIGDRLYAYEISATGAIEAEPETTSFTSRRFVFAATSSTYENIADVNLDISISADGRSMDYDQGLYFHAEGIGRLETDGGLSVVAGWEGHSTANLQFTVDTSSLSEEFERMSPDERNAKLEGYLRDSRLRQTLQDADGIVVDVNNGDWAAAGVALAPGFFGAFGGCVWDCFSDIGTALTISEFLCISAGLIACGATGPGWGACATLVLSVCGLTFTGAQLLALIACLIACF